MSEKVLIIDLNNMTCDVQKYSYETAGSYGRGLLIDLFCDHVSDKADRYSPENIIAIVPGLFTGNPAPSACRMLVATIEGREKGIQVSNTTGNMPQKLDSGSAPLHLVHSTSLMEFPYLISSASDFLLSAFTVTISA